MLQDATAQQTAKLIYQTALLESGFLLEDPKYFASQVYSVMRTSLNVSPNATIDEEEEIEEIAEAVNEDQNVSKYSGVMTN